MNKVCTLIERNDNQIILSFISFNVFDNQLNIEEDNEG